MDERLLNGLLRETDFRVRPNGPLVKGIIADLEGNADLSLAKVMQTQRDFVAFEVTLIGEKFSEISPLDGMDKVENFLRAHAQELQIKVE